MNFHFVVISHHPYQEIEIEIELTGKSIISQNNGQIQTINCKNCPFTLSKNHWFKIMIIITITYS